MCVYEVVVICFKYHVVVIMCVSCRRDNFIISYIYIYMMYNYSLTILRCTIKVFYIYTYVVSSGAASV